MFLGVPLPRDTISLSPIFGPRGHSWQQIVEPSGTILPVPPGRSFLGAPDSVGQMALLRSSVSFPSSSVARFVDLSFSFSFWILGIDLSLVDRRDWDFNVLSCEVFQGI